MWFCINNYIFEYYIIVFQSTVTESVVSDLVYDLDNLFCFGWISDSFASNFIYPVNNIIFSINKFSNTKFISVPAVFSVFYSINNYIIYNRINKTKFIE